MLIFGLVINVKYSITMEDDQYFLKGNNVDDDNIDYNIDKWSFKIESILLLSTFLQST